MFLGRQWEPSSATLGLAAQADTKAAILCPLPERSQSPQLSVTGGKGERNTPFALKLRKTKESGSLTMWLQNKIKLCIRKKKKKNTERYARVD